MPLSDRQLLAVTVSERTMSVISITGLLFIIGTFVRWDYFRKPINRLVFCASFGNILANVATLIATSALPKTLRSRLSKLCEFQGILVQVFMMADSFWVFCMALNVMLVFYGNYNSSQLRRLEKWYMLFSYGVPLIPALAFIIIDHYGKKNIIGSATIWCWVSPEAEWMRIAFFYVPVWVVIICTLVIYAITGLNIYKKRAALRSFSRRAPAEPTRTVTNPFTEVAARTIRVQNDIHVHVSNTPPRSSDVDMITECPIFANIFRGSFSSTKNLSTPTELPTSAPSASTRFSQGNWPGPSREPTERNSADQDCSYRATVNARNIDSDLEAGQPRSKLATRSTLHIRRTTAMDGNTAAWGYFKVAFLMFAALFVVWVPSTVNRVQQFVNPGRPIFGLNLASALVLPLQGFWNAMIYILTTWPQCKRAWAEVMDKSSRTKRYPLPDLDGRESQQTLSNNDIPEFETDIPLSEILKQAPPRHFHSWRSSAETMKVPGASSQHQ